MSEHQSSSGTTEQASINPAPDSGVNENAPVGFFVIGIAINLALLAAYLVWAWRRWKRPDPSE